MKGRLTEPQWIALTCDPALSSVVNYNVLLAYRLGRDIEKIPVDLEKKIETKLNNPVALFRIRPLSRDDSLKLSQFEKVAETDIVRRHVIEVHNYDGLVCEMDKDVGHVCLTEKSMEAMDDETIEEVADYLREAARGADGSAGRPFSLGATWRQDRLRSLQLPANIALQDKAAELMNRPNSEEPTPSTDR